MSWQPPQPAGYLESIQTIGSVAAPLLAGASFTLAVLSLQDPSSAPATSRWPDAALALFILSGLAQVGTVQAAAWTRRYMCAPSDLVEWYPDEAADGKPSLWLQGFQKSHLRQALRWAQASRLFFHTGIIALLVGMVVVCVPPHHIAPGRWAVLAVCVAGVLGEFAWMIRAIYLERSLRCRAWREAVLIATAVTAVAADISNLRLLAVATALALAGIAVALPWASRQSHRSPQLFHATTATSLLATAAAVAALGPLLLIVIAMSPAVTLAVRTLIGLARAQAGLRT